MMLRTTNVKLKTDVVTAVLRDAELFCGVTTRCWLCSSMFFFFPENWQILKNTRFQPPGTTVLRLLDLDNVNTMTLRKVCKGKPIDTASHPRKKLFSENFTLYSQQENVRNVS